MAPLLPRSALPPPSPLRDGSLDQPLLSSLPLGRATSPERQRHGDSHHSKDRCNKWKRRICRTCYFWRCKPDSRDHDPSLPSEPEPRRRDPSQPRNEAVLGRETSTLRQPRIVPLETARTTEVRPQQPPVTSPTRTVRFPTPSRPPAMSTSPAASSRADRALERETALGVTQPATVNRR